MTEQEALQQGTGFRKNSWKAFRYVLPFLKPHFKRLSLVCGIDIAIVLLNLAIPVFGKVIIDDSFPAKDWNAVMLYAFLIAGLLLVVYGLTGTRTFLYNATEQLLQLDIRKKMYGHLQKMSLETVESLPVGQQQFRLTTDPDRIAHMLVRIMPTAVMLVEFGLILAAAVNIDPTLTWIACLFLIPWTIAFVYVTEIGRTLDRRRLQYAETRDSGIIQAASSFAIIKALGRVRTEIRRNAKVQTGLQRIANQGYLILVFFEFATQRFLPFVKTTTIYVLLARKVVTGTMTLGATVPMIAYLSRLTFPIERIVNFGCWIWQTMVSAERMMQILETEPSIEDIDHAPKLKNYQGNIEFQDVSFSRPGVGKVIENVSLKIPQGKRVAVVGPSGAGKSTLLGLALRLIDPEEGKVLVDDQNLKKIDRTSYLRQCGTVLQETFIFGGTLADNLKLTKPDATNEELEEVLRAVELTAWYESLPDGLDEDLEGGMALSVGQKQRIGIARALLTDANLLLLDEPSSALDPRTEAEIMATIDRVSQGRTVLMVTHRLKTVENFDEIVVLQHGQVTEQGTHKELLQSDGLYARMHRLYGARRDKQETLEGVPS